MLLHRVLAGVVLLGACLGARAGLAQNGSAEPMVAGYVTAVEPGGAFSVQGVPIALTAKTKLYTLVAKVSTPIDHLEAPYVGEPMQVWGRFDKKTHTITAEYVHVVPPAAASIAGKAMIDAATPGGDDVRMVRADGFRLKLTAATTMHYNEPIASLKDLGTNQWITYTGVHEVDGVVTVKEAEVWQNRVDPDEAKLRKSKEFDPALVNEGDRQNGASRVLLGVDEKKLPAHQDTELQARVERIGASLVPAYQRALPATDATKIDFRFQVVDSEQLHEGWGLASGVVQVPYPAITRLTTDAELAALLSDHIATVIEKQALMNAPAKFRLKTAYWAAAVGGLFVPGLGFAGLATGPIAAHIETLAEQQSGRVSLCLLSDAGYDLESAPKTWWLLAPKKPKPMTEVELPRRSSDLYAVLGTTWRK